ncbi:hypothetical protein Prubr_60750 [Polymorphospora rubra]|uniref:Uncharacterized protein n=2 Tax=Polymorphospora rubra TaxID=338584 RepID=A0A810N9F8_9ACTN|nr:hypothetical protein Prubr_60750 [Polymorphospora rubra]
MFDHDGLTEGGAAVQSLGIDVSYGHACLLKMTPVIAVTCDDTGYSGFMRTDATGRVLHDPKGGTFWFDAGAVCLDFAHTGGEGPYAVFETLHEPADLAGWLAQPPLVAVLTVPATTRELTAARTLRQAVWDTAHARAAGRPLPTGAVDVINRAAAGPPLAPSSPPTARRRRGRRRCGPGRRCRPWPGR